MSSVPNQDIEALIEDNSSKQVTTEHVHPVENPVKINPSQEKKKKKKGLKGPKSAQSNGNILSPKEKPPKPMFSPGYTRNGTLIRK